LHTTTDLETTSSSSFEGCHENHKETERLSTASEKKDYTMTIQSGLLILSGGFFPFGGESQKRHHPLRSTHQKPKYF
jgi:hypothetical protein